MWRNIVQGKGVTWSSKWGTVGKTTLHTLPYKTRRTVHMRNKMLAQQKGLPASRVALLWWYAHLSGKANFSPYKHFRSPISVNSVKARHKSMREYRCQLLAREMGSTFFSYYSPRLSWLGREGEPLPGTTFLHIKRGIYTRHLHFTRRKSRNSWWFLKTGGQGSGGPKIGTFFSENTVTLWKDKII